MFLLLLLTRKEEREEGEQSIRREKGEERGRRGLLVKLIVCTVFHTSFPFIPLSFVSVPFSSFSSSSFSFSLGGMIKGKKGTSRSASKSFADRSIQNKF